MQINNNLPLAKILVGDAVTRLRDVADGAVRTCVTSPPYWGLRDYGNDGQLGLEDTPSEFVENLCQVFDEVWRVLADDGTLWVNLGDSYNSSPAGANPGGFQGKQMAENPEYNKAQTRKKIKGKAIDGLKVKDLVGIPWRFAFAMQDRGWYLRQDIIWAKPNPMPESVTDRCTKSHEYMFLFSKQPKYFFDNESIKEKASTEPISRDKNGEGYQADYPNGNRFSAGARVYGADGLRNKRSVWNVGVASFKDAHFAVYPPELITPCILAGSAERDTVLDPFSGSGTTGEVALKLGRNYIGCELNPNYATMSENRIIEALGMFATVTVDDGENK